ncbi:MAG: hypothetical protein ACP5I3_11675 [Thermoproteus sp.]
MAKAMSLLLKALASLAVGFVVYLSGTVLPCLPHVCPYGAGDPQAVWSAFLGVVASVAVFVLADSDKQAAEVLTAALLIPVLPFLFAAFIFFPLSPLLLAASIIAILEHGLTLKVVIFTAFSAVSFAILVSIIWLFLWSRRKDENGG